MLVRCREDTGDADIHDDELRPGSVGQDVDRRPAAR